MSWQKANVRLVKEDFHPKRKYFHMIYTPVLSWPRTMFDIFSAWEVPGSPAAQFGQIFCGNLEPQTASCPQIN